MTTFSETLNRTLSDSAEELRDEARRTARETRQDAKQFARALPYAALGSLRESLDRGRRVTSAVFSMPGRAVDEMRRTPERIRETFWARAEAGEDLVDRARGRKSTRRAKESVQNATSAARGAATSARKAARRTADAVRNATDAVDPNDHRPYEERTVDELYSLAAERDIEGRSQMNKKQLIQALRAERS